MQLVNARDVKNVPGRPKTDKLDAVWLAKLTEKGLLRPSFVPRPHGERFPSRQGCRRHISSVRTHISGVT